MPPSCPQTRPRPKWTCRKLRKEERNACCAQRALPVPRHPCARPADPPLHKMHMSRCDYCFCASAAGAGNACARRQRSVRLAVPGAYSLEGGASGTLSSCCVCTALSLLLPDCGGIRESTGCQHCCIFAYRRAKGKQLALQNQRRRSQRYNLHGVGSVRQAGRRRRCGSRWRCWRPCWPPRAP